LDRNKIVQHGDFESFQRFLTISILKMPCNAKSHYSNLTCKQTLIKSFYYDATKVMLALVKFAKESVKETAIVFITDGCHQGILKGEVSMYC